MRWVYVALATGCAMKPPMAAAPADYDEYAAADGIQMSESVAVASRAPASAKRGFAASPAPPPPPPPMAPEPMPDSGPAQPTGAAEAPAAQRMVHYDGWARLRVANPRESLEAVVAVAAGAGGRTEQMAGTTVTVRVPVATFEATWRQILALGDVMDRSVRADDVTEQFTAVDLRVRTLRTTRDRLIALLAQSRNEEERLRLLGELTRVSEELDALESQLRTLQELAEFSRITVEAVAREAFTASGTRPTLDGFDWIGGLSPFRRGVWSDDHRVGLDTPEGLVMLAEKGPYSAESADGAVLWTMRVPNDPVGTGAFWVDAIQDRVADEFVNPTRAQRGAWECLSLDQPASDAPYRWQVCVRDDGKHLEVGQVYFPGPEQVKRYEQAIQQVFGGAGGGA
jgi:Domain of unknown function (DUF4349)